VDAVSADELRLGLIGLSEGNGHPYSWAAIFNGYDEGAMASCPFPVIPRYLAEHRFPEEAITDARVTHLWTQDPAISRRVAAAAKIERVVSRPEEMIGEVDALLLARDDAENHAELGGPFLDAGLPVYFDKPLATSVAAARDLFSRRTAPDQLFTCSALRFARELQLDDAARKAIGPLLRVAGSSPKRWSRYAVHAIEPALAMLGEQGAIVSHSAEASAGRTRLEVEWESGVAAELTTLGDVEAPIEIRAIGERGERRLVFEDAFTAFKAALERFVAIVRGEAAPIPDDEVLRVVELIELGMAAGAP